ncbi:c-type cytochrome biogenesis protein CcmI [Rhodobaculum claviforme]|nr:c-type cytochrome biogenesis protein CcmI [Rhodobaculum claviforme]
MAFWITAGILSALVGLTIYLGLVRPGQRTPLSADGLSERMDIKVYRDQLREVERDVARGILSPTDAERLRLEISRRILDADRLGAGPAEALSPMPRWARWTGIAVIPVMILGAFVIYNSHGAPGYPDMPLAQRLADAREARITRTAQAVAEAEMTARATIQGAGAPSLRPEIPEEDAALVQRLRDALRTRPDDLQGHRLLVVSEASLGNFDAALVAQRRVLALMGDDAGPDEARLLRELEQLAGGAEALAARADALEASDSTREAWDELVNTAMALDDLRMAHTLKGRAIAALGDAATADDHTIHADLMIMSAGGYVSPEAEAALERALRMDPGNPLARYFTGLMLSQNDRPDLTFRIWEQLLQDSAPDAPWVAPIRANIEFMAARAGVNYSLPPAGAASAPRLTDADLEAARDMDPGARVQMIEGMVAGLSQRLATQGGSAEEWGRLIAAHGVLGNTAEAAAIWTEAQAVFGARPEQLEVIRTAAREAGVAD